MIKLCIVEILLNYSQYDFEINTSFSSSIDTTHFDTWNEPFFNSITVYFISNINIFLCALSVLIVCLLFCNFLRASSHLNNRSLNIGDAQRLCWGPFKKHYGLTLFYFKPILPLPILLHRVHLCGDVWVRGKQICSYVVFFVVFFWFFKQNKTKKQSLMRRMMEILTIECNFV